jgi:hypothetical protein
MELMSRRKAFQRPREDGIKWPYFIPDIYLNKNSSIA